MKPILLSIFLFVIVIESSTTAQSHMYYPTLSARESQEIQAGEIVMREVKSSYGDRLSMETIGTMPASGETIYQILTDYASYPEFMSAVDKIEIVGNDSVGTTLNYILESMLGVVKRYRIKISSNQLEEKVWKIEWYLVEWPGLSAMETIDDTRGQWLIIQQSEKQSLVQYYVYSDPGYVPFGLGKAVDALGKGSIEEVFQETRQRAASATGS